MAPDRLTRLAGVLLSFVVVLSTTFGAMPSAQADEWRNKQWHLDFLKVTEAHKITKGQGVTVAVVDSGVNGNHPDLKGNVLEGTDVVEGGNGWRDTDGHGTAMASLIAAHGHGENGRDGVLGIAPEARILPIRDHVSTPDGNDDRPQVIKALEVAADSDAKVINFSGTMSGILPEVERAFARDIVFVAGAGNTTQDIRVQQPASYPGVIAVSGLDRNGNFTDESVQGPEVVLSAPAVDLASAGSGRRGTYNTGTGTSGATALVSATAALIRAKYPDLSANGVINRLIKTADDKGPPGRDPRYGFGVVNPLKALTADIPDIDYNPLIGPSAGPSSPATSNAASPGGAADGNNDVRANLVPAVAIVGTTLLLISGAIYLFIRRNRRSRLVADPHSPTPSRLAGGSAHTPPPHRPPSDPPTSRR